MSLKRLLNPADDDGGASGNLWDDDDPRIHPRLEGSANWHPGSTGHFTSGLYSSNILMESDLINEDFMAIDHYDPTSTADPPILSPEDSHPVTSYGMIPDDILHSFTPQVDLIDGPEPSVFVSQESQITESNEQICYGMIMSQKAQLVGRGDLLHESILKIQEQSQQSAVFRVQQSTDEKLFLTFPDGRQLGYLSDGMAQAFRNLINSTQCELDGLASPHLIIDALRRAEKPSDAAIRVNINVYGIQSERDTVGRELSRNGYYLQHPGEQRPGIAYDNPHILRLDGIDDTDTEGDSTASESEVEEIDAASERGEESFQDTIANVYERLGRDNRLHRLEAGEGLTSTLYPHQEEALDFMTQRETGDIPDEYRLWQPKIVNGVNVYVHVITNTQRTMQPDESGGGILADEMGMGKSLTMLVLINKTIKNAHHWAEHQKSLINDSLAETPCPATLVIVPSTVVMNVWTKEITHHLGGSLKIMMYHGRSRKAKEHDAKLMGKGPSPLHNFAWYRVVLDEAHIIRRRETTFHKAVAELRAKSRWCLSGTPIQNSLSDLASLLRFLQLKPLDDPRSFSHWIANPFGVQELKRRAVQALTTLLEAVCLRRTVERVDLPPQREETHTIRLSVEERDLYNRTSANMQRYIHNQAGEYTGRQSPFDIFQLILQLRSVCNHGTYQSPFSWANKNVLLEEMDAVRSLTRNSLDRCLCCRQPLPVLLRHSRQQYIENCHHVLCDECDQDSGQQSGEHGRLHCPLCRSLKGSKHNETLEKTGHSSKIRRIIGDVRINLDSSKSIIFSCWTRTLDIVGKELRMARVRFERIDGKTPSSQRQRILDRFDTGDVPVLIMTTGTGAVGLNLQSVNRVFLVEPQWNPSVERQAIARAMRLGQTQEVLVVRYCVEDSIEERMYAQQTEKLNISRMDFGNDLLMLEHEDGQSII